MTDTVIRRFLVPQVIQTSAMDCGPAVLKALLEGFGIVVSYGRLREACQTSVDGTSIDTIEDLSVQLGLDAEQVMLPSDYLLIDEAQALPAIVVVRLPNGLTHFVVVWNTLGSWVQIMDPGVGRRWITRQRFLDQLFIHQLPVSAQAWRGWAGSPLMQDPLRIRLQALQLEKDQIKRLMNTALADQTWRGVAALDAAVRMVNALVRANGIEPGDEAARLLERFFEENRQDLPDEHSILIPSVYWLVNPIWVDATDDAQSSIEDSAAGKQVMLQGAVLIRVKGLRQPDTAASALMLPVNDPTRQPLTPELLAALQEPAYNPELEIWRLVRQDGLFPLLIVLVGFAAASVGVIIQTLLLQGLLQIGRIAPRLADPAHIVAVLLGFLITLFILNISLSALSQRLGQRLETRLRIAFLEKLPRLSDRYFHSRLISDMAQRAHELRSLRAFPLEVIGLARTAFELLFISIGVIWLQPQSGFFALVATLLFAGMATLSRPFLQERSMRVRTHSGALSRFYLDAMQGLVPLRTHSAERAFRREYEGLLVEWIRANLDFSRLIALLQAIGTILYSACSIWIVVDFVSKGNDTHNIFLILYWTLRLPALSNDFVNRLQQYPMLRNNILRLLEPLSTPEEIEPSTVTTSAPEQTQSAEPINQDQQRGISIAMQDVSVVAGGQTLLSDISFTLQAGEHLAIVGPSGAGKSTLVGLLLGWHKPATGHCLIDDEVLSGQQLQVLRHVTAWVDPAVQLWNRSLHENLTYGNESNGAASDLYLEQADLLDVLERLPDGMQTSLGESGGLVSGGEGQRVRLGRAMNRQGIQLVILDEPFRGLDREKRRLLLQRAREHWRNATLICITHDVGETTAFDRVIVVEDGHIIEDANPASLAAQVGSRYGDMLKAENSVRDKMWQNANWRRLFVDGGGVQES